MSMLGLSSVISATFKYWTENNPLVSSPSKKEPLYQTLQQLVQESITPEECIERCIQRLKIILESVTCDLSQSNQREIETHLEQFNSAADRTFHLSDDDVKISFKTALYEVVTDKWAEAMAHSFYPICSISDEQEKIQAAQKWTHHYFLGVEYLNKCEGLCNFLQGLFVSKCERKTQLALFIHANQVILKRMQQMEKQCESSPAAFYQMTKAVQNKAENDPHSLTLSEKEYLKFQRNLASSVTHYWPDIEQPKQAMKSCIWSGHAIKNLNDSILDPDHSDLFADALKKV
jgi:hypothetical protein